MEITIEQLEELKKANKFVIVDFFATWCGPCKVLGKTLEQVKSEREDVTVVPVDIEENDDLVESFKIRNVPTIVIYKDGEVVTTFNGAVTKDRILTALN